MMHALRFVSKVLKPVLSSFSPHTAPVLWAPCRAITTGKDHVKFGNVGGKMSGPVEEDPFEAFVGKWVQELSVYRNPDGTIKITQITEEMLQQWYLGIMSPSTYQEPAEKPIIYYQRIGTKWRVRTGFQHTGYNINYSFYLGKDFLMHFPENGLYRVLVFEDGSYMKWIFQPHNYSRDTAQDLRVAIIQITEVREDKLIWKTEFPDMSVAIRTYIRA